MRPAQKAGKRQLGRAFNNLTMPNNFNFDRQLNMSNDSEIADKIKRILLYKIPGSVNVTPASTINDRQGVDFWVEMNTAKHLAVDVKIRDKDFSLKGQKYDDLALETWSVMGSKVGWTRDPDKKCDFVLWYWIETGRFYLVPFLLLCNAFSKHWQAWLKEYKKDEQTTEKDGSKYESQCVFVPRAVVTRAIYQCCNGKLTS